MLVKALTIIDSETQKAIFVPLLFPYRHDPKSTVRYFSIHFYFSILLSIILPKQLHIDWYDGGLSISTDRVYKKNEILNLNYWKLKGSLEGVINEEDFAEYGIDPIFYAESKNLLMDSSNQLLTFGVIPNNNTEFSQVQLQSKLKFQDELVEKMIGKLFEEYVSLFIGEGYSNSIIPVRLQYNQIPLFFLTVSRCMSLKFSDLNQENVLDVAFSGKMISLENELRAINSIIKLLEFRLKLYPAGDQHFEEIKNSPVLLSLPQRGIITMQQNEVLVIQSVIARLIQYWHELLQ